MPAVQVWGFKARLIYETQSVPLAMFQDPAYSFSHPSYPLGYPGLLVWAAAWMGRFDRRFLMLVPWSFTAMTLLFLVRRITRAGGVAAWVLPVPLLCLFMTRQQSLWAEFGYAEPVLMFYLVVGVATLWDGIRSGQRSGVILGWVLLGAMGWYKNEAVVLYAAVVAGVAAGWPGRWRILGWSAAGLPLLLAWRVVAGILGAETPDFEWVWKGADSWNWIGQAFRAAWSDYILDGGQSAWLWPLVGISALLHPVRFVRTQELRFLVAMLGVCVVGYSAVYGFSTLMEREAHFHLAALPRLLAVPSTLIPLALLPLVSGSSPASRAIPDLTQPLQG